MGTVHRLSTTDEVTLGAAADRYLATQPLRPMTAGTAVSTSRFLRTVLADRPARPWVSQSPAASWTVTACGLRRLASIS